MPDSYSNRSDYISDNTLDQVSCNYTNQTRQVQIVKIHIGLNQCLERAVFPNNYFDFDAPTDARLEVYTYTIATSVLSDRIPCYQLSRA